jgi:hypothetical protein
VLHIDIPTRAEIQALGAHRAWPAVTITLPTTPLTQAAQADRIALGNAARAALGMIEAKGGDMRLLRAVEAPLLALAEDEAFWAVQAHGLVIHATPAGARAWRLAERVEARMVVEERFRLKPLLQALATPREAMVLALGMGEARLIEMTEGMAPETVKVPGLPRGAADAAGRGSHITRKGDMASGLATSENALLSNYARAVDRALRPLLAGLAVPLVLAASEPMASIFRGLCTYPHLADEGIAGSPDDVTDQALGAAARAVLAGLQAAEMSALAELFRQREAQGRATTEISRAARAAAFGAVDTLLVELGAELPGSIAEADGAVSFSGEGSLTDEITRLAFATGARVVVTDAGKIPGGGPVAAILRHAV